MRLSERKKEWDETQGGEDQVYRTAVNYTTDTQLQLHHRHTTKMNDSKIQAEADSDSSIDSALKREKQLFLTSKKYIFTKNRLQRKDQIISLEIIWVFLEASFSELN